MFEQLHLMELNFLSALADLRTPLYDVFFRILDLFDRELFPILFLPFLWYCYDAKFATRLFFILIISIFCNNFCKEFFSQPRPFELIEGIELIKRSGYGFPSGAAQNAVIVVGMITHLTKRYYLIPLASVAILLMGFSRLYLGVHFPSDVLFGWLIGLSILVPYCYALPRIERDLRKIPSVPLYIIAFLAFGSLGFITHSPISLSIITIAIGSSFGLIYQRSIPDENLKKSEQVKLAFLTLCGLVIIFGVIKALQLLHMPLFIEDSLIGISYFTMGLWLTHSAKATYARYRKNGKKLA